MALNRTSVIKFIFLNVMAFSEELIFSRAEIYEETICQLI